MTYERKADVESALADLESEIALAIRQGAMPDKFQWMATFPTPDAPWFAVLTVGKVGENG